MLPRYNTISKLIDELEKNIDRDALESKIRAEKQKYDLEKRDEEDISQIKGTFTPKEQSVFLLHSPRSCGANTVDVATANGRRCRSEVKNQDEKNMKLLILKGGEKKILKRIGKVNLVSDKKYEMLCLADQMKKETNKPRK